jgi:hypothetical protein
VHVLGHNYVSDQPETVPSAHRFENLNKYVARLRVREQRFAVMATEGYKMELAGLLIALQSPRHEARLVVSTVLTL